MIWVICGAGRCVGKTTLALKLCEILPNRRYAKCGHGVKKEGKPESFFNDLSELEAFIQENRKACEHLVIESNAMAIQSRGDVIIYIDGVKGKTQFRDDADQLRDSAHLVIDSQSKVSSWKKRLSEVNVVQSLCEKIYDVLMAQKQYLYGSAPVVRSKVWFESAGEHIFGMGLARLLENVDRSGSLQAAAKVSGMSYRYAWDLIRTAEKHLGRELIERHAGGTDGGGSALSDHGRRMLETFRQINDDVCAYADARFLKLFTTEKSNAGCK